MVELLCRVWGSFAVYFIYVLFLIPVFEWELDHQAENSCGSLTDCHGHVHWFLIRCSEPKQLFTQGSKVNTKYVWAQLTQMQMCYTETFN